MKDGTRKEESPFSNEIAGEKENRCQTAGNHSDSYRGTDTGAVKSHGIDWSYILQSIQACESTNFLNETLETLQRDNRVMTKEEAVIRLLMDLRQSG